MILGLLTTKAKGGKKKKKKKRKKEGGGEGKNGAFSQDSGFDWP